MTAPKDREELREQIGDIGLEYGEISQYPWVHDPIMALIDAYTTRAVGEAEKQTWWITDGPKDDSLTQKIKGPFTTLNDASMARAILEDNHSNRTYWLQQYPAALPKDTGEATDEQ